MAIKATMANLKKYAGKRGVVMYSPGTGEQYSANVGDYFWAPPNHIFKDSKKHAMILVIPGATHKSPRRK